MTVITLLGCVSVICLLGNTFVSAAVICPRQACKPEVECEFGYATDQEGCPTCDCKISPCALVKCPGCKAVDGKAVCGDKCPVVLCRPCPYGHVYDAENCQTCECKLNPCKLVKCPDCKVVDGQAVCQDTCPAVRCRGCRYGYVYDAYNCQTCECKPNLCETFRCPRNQKCELVWPLCRPESPCYPKPRCVEICPQLRCRSCPYGHEYDANGCKTCRCRPNPCERKICPRHQKCQIRWPLCRTGYPCYPLAVCVDTCSAVRCRLCRFGYVYDANNCQTCECKPNLCETFQCPRNEKCELVWPPCRPESPCYPDTRCVDICPLLMCRQCEFGNVVDQNGCVTCECKKDPCEGFHCAVGADHELAPSLDGRG